MVLSLGELSGPDSLLCENQQRIVSSQGKKEQNLSSALVTGISLAETFIMEERQTKKLSVKQRRKS